MLLFPNTRIISSVERPVALGFTIDQEGQALVADTVGGIYGVKKCVGSGSEQFVGVAVNMLKPFQTAPFNEVLTQGAGNTITLSNTPLVGSILIIDQNTGTVQAFNVGVGPNQYNIAGTVVTLNAGQAGHKYFAAYRFTPTIIQYTAFFGNVHPGGAAGDYLGQCGVITKGDVFTTEFDTSVDWTAGAPVLLGGNGLFTTTGSGNVLSNVSVIAAPGAGLGALGLEIR
jgi:hypothetical protein